MTTPTKTREQWCEELEHVFTQVIYDKRRTLRIIDEITRQANVKSKVEALEFSQAEAREVAEEYFSAMEGKDMPEYQIEESGHIAAKRILEAVTAELNRLKGSTNEK